jgi:hypothetical protein
MKLNIKFFAKRRSPATFRLAKKFGEIDPSSYVSSSFLPLLLFHSLLSPHPDKMLSKRCCRPVRSVRNFVELKRIAIEKTPVLIDSFLAM